MKERSTLSSRLSLVAVLSVLCLWPLAAQATPTRTDLERRERTLQTLDQAADHRSQQARETADRQRQLLDYQIRKNRRMQLRMQCQLAGGGRSC